MLYAYEVLGLIPAQKKGEGEIKESSGGGEFKYDIFDTL
jgi:hypothetical protein